MTNILHKKPVKVRHGKARRAVSPRKKGKRTPGTTRLSVKGQVVIPEAVCQKVGLKRGDQFVVLANKDTVCLRLLRPPSSLEWSKLQELANRLTAEIDQSASSA